MLFGNSILQKEASFFHAQKRVKGRLHKILYTIILIQKSNNDRIYLWSDLQME